jgi:hypothetical protein
MPGSNLVQVQSAKGTVWSLLLATSRIERRGSLNKLVGIASSLLSCNTTNVWYLTEEKNLLYPRNVWYKGTWYLTTVLSHIHTSQVPVFRIHDVLIRIQILGPVPYTGLGIWICIRIRIRFLLSSVAFKRPTKKKFFLAVIFLFIVLTVDKFTSVFTK